MTSEATTETPSASSSREDCLQRAAIDRSVRAPVLFFFFNAALWLVFSATAGMLVSLKLHWPAFFDGVSFLSYQRLWPAQTNAFIYGWATQAAFGVTLWMMARLCRVKLESSRGILLAGIGWNIAVTAGFIGILFAPQNSIQWMEFPTGVWVTLLVCYVLIAVPVIHMFRARRPGHVFISQWYLIAATLWFPWVYLTANLFVHVLPGAGVAKLAVNAWFMGNIVWLWFVPVGLAAAYYLIPKVLGKPIFSYNLALAGFWGLAVLGGWTGMQALMGGPLPAWMSAAGIAASVFLLVPVLAVAVNHHMTTKGNHHVIQHSPTLRFTAFGAVSFTIMGVMAAIYSLYGVAQYTQFTYAVSGFHLMVLYAFFSMIMFGAVYYIVPRLAGCEWPSGRAINTHFWFSAYGIITMIVVLSLAGITQGTQLEKVDMGFEFVTMRGTPFLVGRTLAWAFVAFSNFIFLYQLTLMILRRGREAGEPTFFHDPGHEPPTSHDEMVSGANA